MNKYIIVFDKMLFQSKAISFNLPFFLIFQSRTFHENGKRHQQAVENRLYEIKRKGAKDEKKSTLEEKWLQDMEEKAMSDYRKKDLGNNSDLTAQIFNQKRAQRDAEEEGRLLTFKIKPSMYRVRGKCTMTFLSLEAIFKARVLKSVKKSCLILNFL